MTATTGSFYMANYCPWCREVRGFDARYPYKARVRHPSPKAWESMGFDPEHGGVSPQLAFCTLGCMLKWLRRYRYESLASLDFPSMSRKTVKATI